MKLTNAWPIMFSLLIPVTTSAAKTKAKEKEVEKEPTYALFYKPTPKEKRYVGSNHYTADEASNIKSGWLTSGYGELFLEPTTKKTPKTANEYFVSEIKSGIEKDNLKLTIQEDQPVFRIFIKEPADKKKYIGEDIYSAAEAKDAVFKYRAYNDNSANDLRIEPAIGSKVVPILTVKAPEAKCIEKQMKEFAQFKEKYKDKDFVKYFSSDTTKTTVTYQIKDKTKKLYADEASNLVINFSSTKDMKCNAHTISDFYNFFISFKPTVMPTETTSPMLDKNTR